MRLQLFALFGLAAFALAESCGKTTQCSRTCPGCCTAAGKCVNTESDSSCGTEGALCIDCMAAGSTCDFSSHGCRGGTGGGGAAECTPATCNGCCYNSKVCLPFEGQTATDCGSKGRACGPCAMGNACEMGACVPRPPSVTGQACGSSGVCSPLGTDATCRQTTPDRAFTYPGGYCTRACQQQEECAHDAFCVDVSVGESQPLCLSRCDEPETQSTCRPGYFCIPLENRPVGVCWLLEPFLPDSGVPFTTIGDPCTRTATCDSRDAGEAFCVPEFTSDGGATGFAGGYCSADCKSDPRICSSDGGAVCVSVSAQDSVCQRTCPQADKGQSTCRPGYVCYGTFISFSDGGTAPGVGVCQPRCDNPGGASLCASGARCDDAGYCRL